MIKIWTDGGCDNRARGKHGAWAYVVERAGIENVERVGWALGTTNNRMEIMAALQGLMYVRAERLHHDNVVHVHSDSQYLVNGMVDWARRWRRNGWITASGGKVQNEDLWRALMSQAEGLELRWVWIRGHAGTPLNERADALCTRAMKRARWRAAAGRGL